MKSPQLIFFTIAIIIICRRQARNQSEMLPNQPRLIKNPIEQYNLQLLWMKLSNQSLPILFLLSHHSSSFCFAALICSPGPAKHTQTLKCQRKEPCKLFTVRKRKEQLDEVNTNALCQCAGGYECPRLHTDAGVISGKNYVEDNIRTYSGYCMKQPNWSGCCACLMLLILPAAPLPRCCSKHSMSNWCVRRNDERFIFFSF